MQCGLIAEDLVKVSPQLVRLDKAGKPNAVDWGGEIPTLIRAVQQEQGEIVALKAASAASKAKSDVTETPYMVLQKNIATQASEIASLRVANDNLQKRVARLERHH